MTAVREIERESRESGLFSGNELTARSVYQVVGGGGRGWFISKPAAGTSG